MPASSSMGIAWGGSETLALARELEKAGIPVLLTVQVDSVSKIHQNDAIVPANVAQAVNFYQSNGHLHGQTEIRAADSRRNLSSHLWQAAVVVDESLHPESVDEKLTRDRVVPTISASVSWSTFKTNASRFVCAPKPASSTA